MHGVVVVRFLRGFCDRWWSSRGVERARAGSVQGWGVSSPRFLQASDDSAWSRRARSRRGVHDVVGLRTESSCTESRCTVFCEVFVIAGGVLAESSGLERSPCGDGTSPRPIFCRHLRTSHGVVACGVVAESTMLLQLRPARQQFRLAEVCTSWWPWPARLNIRSVLGCTQGQNSSPWCHAYTATAKTDATKLSSC